MPVASQQAEALQRECLRVYRRYVIEIIEAFNLCPWAKRARLDGRVCPHVVLARAPSPAQVLACVDELFDAAGAEPRIDIGLILLPLVDLDRAGFRRFVADVRAAHAEIHRHREDDGPPTWAMADFHPNANPDTSNANRLVSFLRRSPDPTIQIVRAQALNEVRGAEVQGTMYISPESIALMDPAALPACPEPLHQRVAEANLTTIERVGVEQVAAKLDDIRADRDLSYARILAPVAHLR